MRSVGLLGNEGVEFLLRNNSVEVEVSALDHFLEDVIVSELTEVLGHLAEVLKGHEASLLGIEGDEDLVHLITSLVVRGTGGHHVEELGELDLSAAVLIQFCDHLIDSLGFCLNTEGVNGDFQFCISWKVPLGSIAPPKSRSNRSNPFLISSTSSRVT
jgi:hypothetical protein